MENPVRWLRKRGLRLKFRLMETWEKWHETAVKEEKDELTKYKKGL